MIWSFHNFINHPEDIDRIENGDALIDCNFISLVDNDFSLRDKRALKLINCNLVNVQIHNTSRAEGCNTSQIEFEIDGSGEITDSTPTGKRSIVKLDDEQATDIFASDEIEDVLMWANYKHRIVRCRRRRGKPDVPPGIEGRMAAFVETLNKKKKVE